MSVERIILLANLIFLEKSKARLINELPFIFRIFFYLFNLLEEFLAGIIIIILTNYLRCFGSIKIFFLSQLRFFYQ